MKTTIDIADALLRQAKQEAQREGTTLKAVVERGLRLLFSHRPEKSGKFKPVVVKGTTPAEVFKDLHLVVRSGYEDRERRDVGRMSRHDRR